MKGRPVQLISLDDSYEPDRAVANTIRLINEYQVFLLIGEVGTPTSRAVLPLIQRYNVPFFAPFTGDELLRTPFNPKDVLKPASLVAGGGVLAAAFLHYILHGPKTPLEDTKEGCSDI